MSSKSQSTQDNALPLKEVKLRLESTQVGKGLLRQHYDGDDEILPTLLRCMETGHHLRFDGLYICPYVCHMDGLSDVCMRFHPNGFAAMTKTFEKDTKKIFNDWLIPEGSDRKVHKFHYKCTLEKQSDNKNLFKITFVSINQDLFYKAYGPHPPAYIRNHDGQLSHEYTDQNWTHTRWYEFEQLIDQDDDHSGSTKESTK